jgi:hypothetical protein
MLIIDLIEREIEREIDTSFKSLKDNITFRKCGPLINIDIKNPLKEDALCIHFWLDTQQNMNVVYCNYNLLGYKETKNHIYPLNQFDTSIVLKIIKEGLGLK